MNISEEAVLEFRLRKIYKTRNNLLDETKHDLMIEKYKKTCKYLNYVQHLVSISAFTSLVCILVGITSSTVEIKICATTAGLKKYKSIIKKKKKKHEKNCNVKKR